jgi:hypothetical protein
LASILLRVGTVQRLALFAIATALSACGTSSAGGLTSRVDAGYKDAAANLPEKPLSDAGSFDAATVKGPDARASSLEAGASDAGDLRHFRLATTGAQLVVSGPALGFQLTDANVADDADVFAVHQEFYGLPWDAFEKDTAPPAEWVAVMDGLRDAATRSGHPVFLSVTMLDGQRQHLADQTQIQSGAVKTVSSGSAACYDFNSAADASSKKAAYVKYVTYMVKKFQPKYLNVAIEVNLFFEKCPAAAAGVIDVANAAYEAGKALAPNTVVFPSIQIDHLYGYSSDSCADQTAREACFDANYSALVGLRRDRFAMSTYPYMNEVGTPGNLPADWFTKGAARGGEKPLIAETGWPSTDIVVKAKDGTCPTVFHFDEPESAAYLARVLSDAEKHRLELVTWWSDRDLVVSDLMTNCPCTFDATWCTVLDIFRGPVSTTATDTQFVGELLLKAFGTMGIRHYDGTPKPEHYALWTAARQRPIGQ